MTIYIERKLLFEIKKAQNIGMYFSEGPNFLLLWGQNFASGGQNFVSGGQNFATGVKILLVGVKFLLVWGQIRNLKKINFFQKSYFSNLIIFQHFLLSLVSEFDLNFIPR